LFNSYDNKRLDYTFKKSTIGVKISMEYVVYHVTVALSERQFILNNHKDIITKQLGLLDNIRGWPYR